MKLIKYILILCGILAGNLVGYNSNYTIVMFGDSITQEGNWPKLLNRTDILNFCFPGEITANMRKNAASIGEKKPKICFIMGGINDISYHVPIKQTFENLRGIALELKSMGIIPVVQSTIHIADNEYSVYRWNDKVTELNKLLSGFCKISGIEYLDLNQYFSENGHLKAIYTYDGIHLKAKAYSIWSEKINDILKKYNI